MVDIDVTGIVDNPLTPTKICEIRDYGLPQLPGTPGDHLHLKVVANADGTGRTLNPLGYTLPGTTTGGPTGWFDTLSPTVGSTTLGLSLYRAGPEFQLPFPASLGRTLYGAVDVLAKAQDRNDCANPPTPRTSGIYRMSWLVQDLQGVTLSGPFESFRFDQLVPPVDGAAQVGLIYNTHLSVGAQSSTFRYWATNAITLVNGALTVQDRSWNTNLRKGQPWDGVSASSNFNAQTPDGPTVLAVQAFDFAANGGTLSSSPPVGAQQVTLTVDNWWPYVQDVKLTQGSWSATRSWGSPVGIADGSLALFLTPADPPKVGPGVTTVKLSLSEAMRPNNPIIQVLFGLQTLPVSQTSWTGRVWEGTVTLPVDLAVHDQVITVQVNGLNGVRDLAGHLMDAHPGTFPYRPTGNEGSFIGVESGGVDASYTFRYQIEPQPRPARIMLVLDRSGSMGSQTDPTSKLSRSKAGSIGFAGIAKTGEAIGLVTFDTNAQLVRPLADMTSTNITALTTAIGSVISGGNTNIGEGLQLAAAQLPAPHENDWIILLSNGVPSAGTPLPIDVINSGALLDIKVASVAIPPGANPDLMREIADRTGGFSGEVTGPNDLQRIFTELWARVREDGLQTHGQQGQAASVVPSRSVLIDPFMKEAVFVLEWDQNMLQLSLTGPGGTGVTPTSLPPGASMVTTPTFQGYRIPQPPSGTWTLHIEEVGVVSTRFSTAVMGLSPSLQARAWVDQTVVITPTPVLIQAFLQGPAGPISTATVTGTVRRGNGTTVNVTLAPVGGGQYQFAYSDYPAEGVYTIRLQMWSFGEAGTPPFVRIVETTTLVRFAPVTTVLYGSPTVVDANGLRWVTPTSAISRSVSGSRSPFRTEYQVDGGVLLTYAAPFTLTLEGPHAVRMRSVDSAQIAEPFRDYSIWVDAVAPTTFLGDLNGTPLGFVVSPGGAWWTPTPVISLVAEDAGAGVAMTQLRLSGSGSFLPAAQFSLTPNIATIVEWFSQDLLGHVEPTHRLTLLFDPTKDVTPPVTSVIPSQPEILDPQGNVLVVMAASRLTLVAEDPVTDGFSSGVNRIQFGIDTALAGTVYVGPLSMSLLTDGFHSIVLQAVDQAGNVEPLQTVSFVMDQRSPFLVKAQVASAYQGTWQSQGNAVYALQVVSTPLNPQVYPVTLSFSERVTAVDVRGSISLPLEVAPASAPAWPVTQAPYRLLLGPEGVPPYQIIVNWGEGSEVTSLTVTGAAALAHQFSRPGTFSVNWTVTDAAGAIRTRADWVTVRGSGSGRSPLRMDVTPVNPAPRQVVTAALHPGSLLTDDHWTTPPAVVWWAWGDEATPRLTAASQMTHAFSLGGEWPVVASAQDGQGVALGEAVRIVHVEQACTAHAPFQGTVVSYPDLMVAVPVQAGGTAPLLYRVAWGDGQTTWERGEWISHRYPSSGAFHVTLTVVDGAGRSSMIAGTILVSQTFSHGNGGGGVPKGNYHLMAARRALGLPSVAVPGPRLAPVTDPVVTDFQIGRVSLSNFTGSSDGKVWTGIMRVTGQSNDPEQIFTFKVTGQDLASNTLTALTPALSPFTQSTRQANGNWLPVQNLGADQAHRVVLARVPRADPPDALPPVTTVTIGYPQRVSPAGVTAITSVTPITWVAQDNAEGAGVAYTELALGRGAWQRVTPPYYVPFTQSDGPLVLYLRSVDLLGNTETPNTFSLELANHAWVNGTWETPGLRETAEPTQGFLLPREGERVTGNAVSVVVAGSVGTRLTLTDEKNRISFLPTGTIRGNLQHLAWDTTSLTPGRYALSTATHIVTVVVDPVQPDRWEQWSGNRGSLGARLPGGRGAEFLWPNGTVVTVPSGPTPTRVTVETIGREALSGRELPPVESSWQPVGDFLRCDASRPLTVSVRTQPGAQLARWDTSTTRWQVAPLPAKPASPSPLWRALGMEAPALSAVVTSGLVGWFSRAPASDLSHVIVYPNPFKPNSHLGHTAIIFDGLPTQIFLRLYTPSGRVVKTYQGPTDGAWSWDATNDQGEPVASGVYLYVMESGGKRVSGKLAIIR